MHLYMWSISRLRNKLAQYSNGQIQIETKDGIYRGEIDGFDISDNPKERKLTVAFKWWCVRRIKNNDIHTHTRVVVWEEIPLMRRSIDIKFKWYYFQRDRPDRRERVKLKTDFGESLRFYKPDDPTNLVRNTDGEFVEIEKLQTTITE